jgi:hypothetical protein
MEAVFKEMQIWQYYLLDSEICVANATNIFRDHQSIFGAQVKVREGAETYCCYYKEKVTYPSFAFFF